VPSLLEKIFRQRPREIIVHLFDYLLYYSCVQLRFANFYLAYSFNE